jgi:hypothetical protein
MKVYGPINGPTIPSQYWPVTDVEMIVHQQDEWIVHLEVLWRHETLLDAPDRRIQVPLEER